jgi:hypothetical protein
VAPSLIVSALLAVRVAIGVPLTRRERGYGAIVVWTFALAAAWSAQAIAGALAFHAAGIATARAALVSLGAWAVARHVIEGRSTLPPIALAIAVAALGFDPALTAGAREWLREGVLVIGATGAAWSIRHGLARDEVAEPGLSELVTLVYAAIGVAGLVSGGEPGWTRAVPALFATGAALAAEARWLVRARRKSVDASDRDEQLRPAERVGDLVDLAEAVRGRAERGASAARSTGEP